MSKQNSIPADRIEAANALVRGVPEEDEEEEEKGNMTKKAKRKTTREMDIRNEKIHILEFVASDVSP